MKHYAKYFLIAGILLLAYGYLCRIIKLYFFWDSKAFGWILLSISLLLFLFHVLKGKHVRREKTIWVKLAIAMLIMGQIILPVVLVMIKKSEAYIAAEEYLIENHELKDKVGEIRGFGLIPVGGYETHAVNGAESGIAKFKIIVKGSKKYTDVSLTLKKTPETFWEVIDFEK